MYFTWQLTGNNSEIMKIYVNRTPFYDSWSWCQKNKNWHFVKFWDQSSRNFCFPAKFSISINNINFQIFLKLFFVTWLVGGSRWKGHVSLARSTFARSNLYPLPEEIASIARSKLCHLPEVIKKCVRKDCIIGIRITCPIDFNVSRGVLSNRHLSRYNVMVKRKKKYWGPKATSLLSQKQTV